MKIIRPALVDDTSLVATSVPETVPAWASGTTYARGARAQDPATHREYESQQDNNTGHALTDAAYWADAGATNPWRMFDQSNSSQTVAADEIVVDLKIPGRVDAIALLNCQAAAAQVTAKVNGTTVYDATFPMTSSSGIETWYDYFFEPIERRLDLILTDLPLYSNMDVRVRITRPGGTVMVGTLVIGQQKDLGLTELGMSAGINDFSRKMADDFGNYRLVERAFSKKLDVRLLVQNDQINRVHELLTRLRATPVVWVAADRFSAGGVYGFYRNFSTTFAYPEQSLCLLEIEGLT